jgi:hypothetical protein
MFLSTVSTTAVILNLYPVVEVEQTLVLLHNPTERSHMTPLNTGARICFRVLGHAKALLYGSRTSSLIIADPGGKDRIYGDTQSILKSLRILLSADTGLYVNMLCSFLVFYPENVSIIYGHSALKRTRSPGNYRTEEGKPEGFRAHICE